MSIRTRVFKIEQAPDSSRPRVATVFLECPTGDAVRLFNSAGVELPPDTEWQSQKPAAKVFVGVSFDDV